jgi:hypothetical protein
LLPAYKYANNDAVTLATSVYSTAFWFVSCRPEVGITGYFHVSSHTEKGKHLGVPHHVVLTLLHHTPNINMFLHAATLSH